MKPNIIKKKRENRLFDEVSEEDLEVLKQDDLYVAM
jgi:hypothetical protein